MSSSAHQAAAAAAVEEAGRPEGDRSGGRLKVNQHEKHSVEPFWERWTATHSGLHISVLEQDPG